MKASCIISSALAQTLDGADDIPQSAELERHDKAKHGGHFDPSTMSCKFRDDIAKMAEEDRMYATSDIHHAPLESVNPGEHRTVVIAGDMMGAGYFSPAEGEAWLKKQFFPWCEKHSDKKIVVIPGNHDLYIEDNADKIKWPENVEFLVDREANINGMRVYGTPWCRRHANGAYEVGSARLTEEFSKIPEGLDVLITHTPPYVPGEDIDLDDTMKSHFGSPELTKAILEKKPKLVICGHIHTGSHKPIKIGDTTVVNVSMVGDDRGKAAHGGRSIGISRSDDGTGFILDTDDDTKIETHDDGSPANVEPGDDAEKKDDPYGGVADFFSDLRAERTKSAYLLPDEVMDFYFASSKVAKEINRNIDSGRYRPDPKAMTAMKDAWGAFSKFRETSDNPFVHALSITAWEIAESARNGFRMRINRTPALPTELGITIPPPKPRAPEPMVRGITDYFYELEAARDKSGRSGRGGWFSDSTDRSSDRDGLIPDLETGIGGKPAHGGSRPRSEGRISLGDIPVSTDRPRKDSGGKRSSHSVPSSPTKITRLKDFKSWLGRK